MTNPSSADPVPVCGWGLTCGDADLRLSCQVPQRGWRERSAVGTPPVWWSAVVLGAVRVPDVAWPSIGTPRRAIWVVEVIFVADKDPMRRTPEGGDAVDRVGGAILDALFTRSPVGLHVLDTGLRVVRVNSAARSMRGVSVEGLVGLHFAEAYAGLSAPDEVEEMLRGVLESGVPVREYLVRARMASEQGREGIGSVSVFRLQDPQGTVLGLTVTVVDVTEQEQARARKRVLNTVRERVGRTLDVIATCQELVETLVPGFADIAMVDIVDAVVHGEESPTGPLAQDVALRRAAYRARDGLKAQDHPVSDVRSLNLLTPYAQAMSDFRPRLVPVSPGIPWLDAARAGGVRAVGAHTLIVAPLVLRGTALGVLSLIRAGGSDPYNEDDVGLAADVASHTALCIDNARRFTREYTIAATVQRHQFPRCPASHSTVETAHLHVLGASGGGGWFDTIPLSGARTALVVGEVTGRGIQTATTMGQLRTVIRSLAALDLQPDELLARLNDTAAFLAAERAARHPSDPLHPQPLSANCVYAVYDPVTRTCTFARAGHTTPVIIRPDSSTEVPDSTPGPLLGSAEGPPSPPPPPTSPTAASSPSTPPRSCPHPPSIPTVPPRACTTSSLNPAGPSSTCATTSSTPCATRTAPATPSSSSPAPGPSPPTPWPPGSSTTTPQQPPPPAGTPAGHSQTGT